MSRGGFARASSYRTNRWRTGFHESVFIVLGVEKTVNPIKDTCRQTGVILILKRAVEISTLLVSDKARFFSHEGHEGFGKAGVLVSRTT
jgi:hypothetical protein